MRVVEVKRETKETKIAIRLNPDRTGKIIRGQRDTIP